MSKIPKIIKETNDKLEGKSYTQIKCHINDIKAGDTVIHDNKLMTVSKNNIKKCEFMGKTLFGDNYQSGNKLVIKVEFKRA